MWCQPPVVGRRTDEGRRRPGGPHGVLRVAQANLDVARARERDEVLVAGRRGQVHPATDGLRGIRGRHPGGAQRRVTGAESHRLRIVERDSGGHRALPGHTRGRERAAVAVARVVVKRRAGALVQLPVADEVRLRRRPRSAGCRTTSGPTSVRSGDRRSRSPSRPTARRSRPRCCRRARCSRPKPACRS